MQSIEIMQPTSILMNSSMSLQKGAAQNNETATEFESLVISQLLKQMRSTSEEGGLFPGDKSDTYGGMFDMYFGKFLAENGGLGLADFVNNGLQKSIES